MYDWIRPEIIVPVHGEPRHMAEHARFALVARRSQALRLQRNGDLIRLAPNGPEKLTEVRVGRLVLDGDVILPADGTTITERRRMSYSGLVTVALPVGSRRQAGRQALHSPLRPAGRGGPGRFHRRRDRFRRARLQSGLTAEEQLREDGAAGGSPLRDSLDRQEAARRGDAGSLRTRPHAMKWTSISAIYFLFFAASAFVLLPFGVRTDEEVGAERVARAGGKRAPHFDLKRHLLRAALLAAVLFAALLRELDLRLDHSRRPRLLQ